MSMKKKYKQYLKRCEERGKKPKDFATWLERRKEKKSQNSENNKIDSKRTIEDFVEDMISDGHTLEDIKTVASNTRWAPLVDTIMEVAKKFQEKLKKNFSKLLRSDDNITS